jgi:coenzyme F420 biosynthesis associated uncharacterized protein
MVDWSIARQIARLAAGSGPPAGLAGRIAAHVAGAEREVGSYTGLELVEPVPPPEAVDRGVWADANLDAIAALLDPVARRVESRLAAAGPLAGALRAVTGATIAAEAGLVVGYMATRVLGQFEVSLLQPRQPTRLLFVEPNIERAVRELGVDREAFLGWIALHEVTHAFQFGGVPWLRDHLGDLLRRYLRTVEVRIERGAAGGVPSLPSISQLVERFREGGLIALVQTHEQRGLIDGLQAVMAVVEGYSEHVMDAVGERVVEGCAELRQAMDRRRRSRSAPERVIEHLLGFDLKLRQYEEGRAFCDAVVARGGLALLNRVWEGPRLLPTLRELRDPGAWAERVGAVAAA